MQIRIRNASGDSRAGRYQRIRHVVLSAPPLPTIQLTSLYPSCHSFIPMYFHWEEEGQKRRFNSLVFSFFFSLYLPFPFHFDYISCIIKFQRYFSITSSFPSDPRRSDSSFSTVSPCLFSLPKWIVEYRLGIFTVSCPPPQLPLPLRRRQSNCPTVHFQRTDVMQRECFL